MKLLEKDKEGVVNSQLQWQLNLLAHVESLQDEVIHRMDFIEKELDGRWHFSVLKANCIFSYSNNTASLKTCWL